MAEASPSAYLDQRSALALGVLLVGAPVAREVGSDQGGGGFLLTKLAATGFTLAFTTALGTLWAGRIGGFDAFLFVVFALMAIGALLLIVPYMGSIGKSGEPASAMVR